MPASLVAETHASSSNGTDVTTSAIDTTGATLIVVCLGWRLGSGSLTDSKGNTWTALTARSVDSYSTWDATQQMFYCSLPTVGSGHTFTGVAELPTIKVYAFTGPRYVSPLHQETGATVGFAGAASLSTGNLTPTIAGVLAVSMCASSAPAGTSPNIHSSTTNYAGWTLTTIDDTANSYELGTGWMQTTDTAAIHVLWEHFAVVSVSMAVNLALFGLVAEAGAYDDGDPGELTAVTLTDRDDTARPFAEVDLCDEPDYYDGYKAPRILETQAIDLALSDYRGQRIKPTFGVVLNDSDNELRGLFDSATNRFLMGCPLVVRTVTDEDRRLELPMRIEMVGSVTRYTPTEDGRFVLEGSDFYASRIAKRAQAPERWVTVLTRAIFALLPTAAINKGAPIGYGRISDAVSGVTPDPGVYPRNSYDPNWLSLGYNHLSPVTGPPDDDYVGYVSFIKGGLESTVIPFPVGFHLDGTQQAYLYFSTIDTPDLYRIYFAKGGFHPILNPTGGDWSRYKDVDPSTVDPAWTDGAGVQETDPFGNTNTESKRFVLIDAGADPTTWGDDYQAIAGSGGSVVRAPRGAIGVIHVGEETTGGITRSAFLVMRGAMKTITNAYVGGVEVTNIGSAYEIEVPHLGDYSTVFGANYRDIGGYRWTIVYATGQTAINAINGSAKITLNGEGIESVGDCSGTLITSPAEQLYHFDRNFVQADLADSATLWLDAPVTLPGSGGVPAQDPESLEAATAALVARVSGGYETAGFVNPNGEIQTADAVYAAFAFSGDFDYGTNRRGQTIVSVEPSSAPAAADVIEVSEVLEISDRSFRSDVDQSGQCWNLIKAQYAKDFTGATSSGWYRAAQLPDAASIANYGERPTDITFPFLRASTTQQQATTLNVLQTKRTRWRHPRRPVRFAVPYGLEWSDRVVPGVVFRVTHSEGFGASGWTGHDVRATKIRTNLDAGLYEVEGYDLQPIYDGLDDSDVPDFTDNDEATTSLIDLETSVQNTQLELASLQAEIAELDARLTVLESGVLEYRTSDPSILTNGMMWGYVDGSTPPNFFLKVRHAGQTYTFPIGSLDA